MAVLFNPDLLLLTATNSKELMTYCLQFTRGQILEYSTSFWVHFCRECELHFRRWDPNIEEMLRSFRAVYTSVGNLYINQNSNHCWKHAFGYPGIKCVVLKLCILTQTLENFIIYIDNSFFLFLIAIVSISWSKKFV